MALIHDNATVSPSKLELLRPWLASQPWANGIDPDSLEPVGTYRFDDPAGEIGIETFLLQDADGSVLQVPVTYRAEPLTTAEAALIGMTEHSVLGTRWVYDGCADPVYVRTLADTIVSAGTQADLEFASGGHRTSPTQVRGTGDEPLTDLTVRGSASDAARTRIELGSGVLTVLRRPNADPADAGATAALTGSWPGSAASTVLVELHRR